MKILPPAFDPAWQADLSRRADHAPLSPRLPLYAGPALIGSLAPALIDRLAVRGLEPASLGLLFTQDQLGARWCLDGDPTQVIGRLAMALQAVGLVSHWHGELLSVLDPAGRCVGAVERGVTRLLGIPNHAIHLVGVVEGTGTWVQQRSLNKAEAPGLWDTLMGGTVAFGESPERALERELWEEAGLAVGQLGRLESRGCIRVARPSGDTDALGYSVDQIDCLVASLPAGLWPVNRDGEVLRFELLTPQALADRLVSERFTLEAACVLLRV